LRFPSEKQGKESGSFLKKRTKKLLLLRGLGVNGDNARDPEEQSFFASFCSQKEVLP
jgi:hypothetical protein